MALNPEGEVTGKANIEASVKQSKYELSDAEHGVQGLQLTKDSDAYLATMVDEAENGLGISQKYVLYLEERVPVRLKQRLANDAEAANERKRLSKLEDDLTSPSPNLEEARA